MSDELNEFLKELVTKINQKFKEQKVRISQLEAKIISLQKEVESLKESNKTKINKDILKELE
jgi:cell division septum initiation protein DivIVA